MTANRMLTRKAPGTYVSVHGEYDITLSPKREGDPKECMTTMWSALDSKGIEVARTRSLPEMKDAIYALMTGHQPTADEATDLPKWQITLLEYAQDAQHWGDTPWVSVGNIAATKTMKDHLRYAQKRHMIVLGKSSNKEQYVMFTDKGAEWAKQQGFNVEPMVTTEAL